MLHLNLGLFFIFCCHICNRIKLGKLWMTSEGEFKRDQKLFKTIMVTTIQLQIQPHFEALTEA